MISIWLKTIENNCLWITGGTEYGYGNSRIKSSTEYLCLENDEIVSVSGPYLPGFGVWRHDVVSLNLTNSITSILIGGHTAPESIDFE